MRPYSLHRLAIVAPWVARQPEAVCADDLRARFGLSQDNANQVLSRLCRAGVIQRLEPGVYRPVRSEAAQ